MLKFKLIFLFSSSWVLFQKILANWFLVVKSNGIRFGSTLCFSFLCCASCIYFYKWLSDKRYESHIWSIQYFVPNNYQFHRLYPSPPMGSPKRGWPEIFFMAIRLIWYFFISNHTLFKNMHFVWWGNQTRWKTCISSGNTTIIGMIKMHFVWRGHQPGRKWLSNQKPSLKMWEIPYFKVLMCKV